MRAFFVAGLVDRLQHLFAELRRVGEDVLDQFRREIRELRQVALLVDLQKFVQNKAVIVERRSASDLDRKSLRNSAERAVRRQAW